MWIELGIVTAPTGQLLIVDPGYLNLWCHDRRPVMPEGVLSSPEATFAANGAVDLEIVGRDATLVGTAFDRQWNPRFLFDIPRAGVAGFVRSVGELARAKNLDAHVVEMSERIPHRRRIELALEAGGGAGEVQFHGIWATAVAGLPEDRALRVVGEPMPDGRAEAGRLRSVAILAREGVIARAERLGHVMVDWGRLLALDVGALSLWKTDESLDGKADFVFWGRDAEKVAGTISAPRVGETEYGWRNLPVDLAEKRGREVLRAKEGAQAVFAHDYRPHSHHFLLMEQVRSSQTESGVVPLPDAVACGFATTWGDGIFEVYRDLDREGRLLSIRIELGTEQRVALMAKLRLRWWGRAFVSRMIIDRGEPIRFMYREATDRENDSGWRMFSGYESEEYNDDPKNVAVVLLDELAQRDKRVDALLDEPVGSVFERKPGEEDFARVSDWAPKSG
jgi:hypothetical protein